MRNRESGFSLTRLVFGLGIIAIGLLFSLDSVDALNARDYLEYWPILLIAVGLTRVASLRPPDIVFTVLFVGLGTWLLLYNLEYTDAEPWRYFWPIILVIIGTFLVAGGLRGRRAPESDDFVRGFAVLSGFERNTASTNFQGADLTAILGGCELDLRQAKIGSRAPEIEVFAFWGGVEIRVPQEWRLDVQVWPILGGLEDETEQSPAPEGPVVTIKGAAVMGGVGIKN
jgi:hypothetical protein